MKDDVTPNNKLLLHAFTFYSSNFAREKFFRPKNTKNLIHLH